MGKNSEDAADSKELQRENALPNLPSTWPGACFAIVLILLIAGLIVYYSYSPEGRRGLHAIVATFNSEGKIDTPVDTVFVFSTPSWLTKYDIAKIEGSKPEDIKKKYPWYFVEDPETEICNKDYIVTECLGKEVSEFIDKLDSLKADELKNRIQGYEFYESVGSGSQPIKRVLTWKLTVPNGSTFNRDELIQLYVSHWKRKNGIYIEELTIPISKKRN